LLIGVVGDLENPRPLRRKPPGATGETELLLVEAVYDLPKAAIVDLLVDLLAEYFEEELLDESLAGRDNLTDSPLALIQGFVLLGISLKSHSVSPSLAGVVKPPLVAGWRAGDQNVKNVNLRRR
jgi:hypothetical protein